MSRKKKIAIMKEMRRIYYGEYVTPSTPHKDFMGYDINEFNTPTYHHIEKASNLRHNGFDDTPTIENGAYLGCQSHDALHHIEERNIDLYYRWNSLFERIVKTRNVNDPSVVEYRTVLQKESEECLEQAEDTSTWSKRKQKRFGLRHKKNN